MIGLITHAVVFPGLFAEINVEHLRELQRFAEVGRVSASLIHDISSPLTAAILHLEQEERRGLSSIRHARRSIRVLERYVEAARQQLRQESCTASFCVRHEINQVKRILQPLAKRQHIRLRFSRVQASHKLVGDPVKFQQILANLITNAIDAYREQPGLPGKPLVRVTITTDQQWLVIQVQDWGKGITAEQLPRLFEPFYTTKQSATDSGVGIGLATVKRNVEDAFGGHINVVSSFDKGSKFCVKLRLPK